MMTPYALLDQYLAKMPIIAILRGVTPEQVIAVAELMIAQGIQVIEVPLNSPQAFQSIQLLVKHFGDAALFGGGTVLQADDVDHLYDCGARLVVSPNMNCDVVSRTVDRGMVSLPGTATPTEAFAALDSGATGLKLFPASSYGPDYIKALTAVLPEVTRIFAVGGVGADNYAQWAAAGISGIGVGKQLFKPDYSLEEIADRVQQLTQKLKS
jgi:2-dehydro-3-deoxyphosphogalactonate aldolase